MANVGNPPAALDMREVKATAGTLGLEVVPLEIRRAEDIALAFDALKGQADAVYVCTDPLVFTNRTRINTLALAARLPTMHGFREFVETGGLMSYGTHFPNLFRRAGIDWGNVFHRTSDLPFRRTPENRASSAVALRAPMC